MRFRPSITLGREGETAESGEGGVVESPRFYDEGRGKRKNKKKRRKAGRQEGRKAGRQEGRKAGRQEGEAGAGRSGEGQGKAC